MINSKFIKKTILFMIVFLLCAPIHNARCVTYYREPQIKIFKFARGIFKERRSFLAYDAAFYGGVSIAAGNLNNDESFELISSSGTASKPQIKVFNSTGEILGNFLAYSENMDKGVNVAVGDVDADGKDEIITAPKAGVSPHVRVFSGTGEPKFNLGFFAYSADFKGGVNIAACDINGDGKDEIITGSGLDSNPQVRVFDYEGKIMIKDFWPFSESDRGGVTVGCANVDGGQEEEIIIAIQSSEKDFIKIYKGNDEQSVLSAFSAWSDNVKTGINVSGGDVNADRRDEIIVAIAGSDSPQIKIFTANGQEINQGFIAYKEDFKGGVYVSSANLDNDEKDEIIVSPLKLKPTGRTDLERYVFVDLSEQRLYAYKEGYLENSFLISSGLTGPTPVGDFKIFHKIYNHLYSGPGYYLPNTLYNMEFYPHYYLHGAYWHNNFGHPMSHGCVNISYPDAEWLFNWTDVGTPVIIQY